MRAARSGEESFDFNSRARIWPHQNIWCAVWSKAHPTILSLLIVWRSAVCRDYGLSCVDLSVLIAVAAKKDPLGLSQSGSGVQDLFFITYKSNHGADEITRSCASQSSTM